jgi:hypothetical protein
MRHRSNGPRLAASAHQTLVLSRQIAVLDCDGGMSRFDQRALEAAIALARAAGEGLAPALMVAGSNACPGGQMPGRGKGAQGGADFGHNLLGRRFAHARHGVQMGDGTFKREAQARNLGLEAGDTGIHPIDVGPQFA